MSRNDPRHPDAWWAAHNLVAHPVSEACYWLGRLASRLGARPVVDALDRFAAWIHDATIPAHDQGTGRG